MKNDDESMHTHHHHAYRTHTHTQETLKEMGEWAARYELIAAMGYLSALLMIGKAINNLGKIARVCMYACIYVCV